MAPSQHDLKIVYRDVKPQSKQKQNKTNEPNHDIRDIPLPGQETGICDISQERVADDKDKRENQNEQDSEIHNITIHVTIEPNQDIRDSLLPGQERGICEITDEQFNDLPFGKMDILEKRDEKSCQYDTNEIKMPNHDSVMAQNQGEVPHNNIKENCTSISEHSSTVDQIQHQSLDNANVSNANKLHGSSSESIIATSVPPNTKKEKLHKPREQKKVADTTGQKNDDSVQTTKTRLKWQRRSQSPKKYTETL